MQRHRIVSVPASSANLGPGFDSMAVALGLRTEVEVVETGEFDVVSDLAIAKTRANLVVRGFEALHPADRFEFRISSEIPLSGGLGSSAAAYLAGLKAADHIFELDADLLALGTELEGHPDNVAAAMLGGLVLCADGRADRIPMPDILEAVLVVPDEPVRTTEARAALPAEVPMADAVFNTAHSALLAAGLTTGELTLIARGLADRIHQPYRAHLFPRSFELLSEVRELGALGATISGAGPTVLVWCTADNTGAVVEALRGRTDGWATVLRVSFEPEGANVVAL